MPIWTVAEIADEPEIRLNSWRLYEAVGVYGDGIESRHFVGALTDDGSGRVSSRIEQFDSISGRGLTMSGRVYELVGQPGLSSEGEYVWKAFCRINEVTAMRDVTAELLAAPPRLRVVKLEDGDGEDL